MHSVQLCIAKYMCVHTIIIPTCKVQSHVCVCVCRGLKSYHRSTVLCIYVGGGRPISCVCIKGLKIDHRSKVVCVYLGGGQSCVCTKYLKIDCRSTVVCVRGRRRGETNFMCVH